MKSTFFFVFAKLSWTVTECFLFLMAVLICFVGQDRWVRSLWLPRLLWLRAASVTRRSFTVAAEDPLAEGSCRHPPVVHCGCRGCCGWGQLPSPAGRSLWLPRLLWLRAADVPRQSSWGQLPSSTGRLMPHWSLLFLKKNLMDYDLSTI